MVDNNKKAPELIELALEYRSKNDFANAINTFQAVIDSPDATFQEREKARVSIELIQKINSFVNVDLMNP